MHNEKTSKFKGYLFKELLFMLNSFIFWLLLSACGSKMGNPVQPNPNPQNSEITIPALSFDIPSAIISEQADSATELLLSMELGTARTLPAYKTPRNVRYTEMHDWLQRANIFKSDINSYLDKLRQDGIDQEGEFNGLGGDAKVSIKVAPLVNDQEYSYHAVICSSTKPFIYLKWSLDAKKVVAYRDTENIALSGSITAAQKFVLAMQLTKSDAGVEALVKSSGLWPSQFLEVDQPHRDAFTYNYVSSDLMTIKGVSDQSTAISSSSVSPDVYLSGRILGETRWEIAAFAQRIPTCRLRSFDEASTENYANSGASSYNGFCVGIDSLGTILLPGSAMDALLANLQSVGFMTSADISEVKMPETLACPQ